MVRCVSVEQALKVTFKMRFGLTSGHDLKALSHMNNPLVSERNLHFPASGMLLLSYGLSKAQLG